MATLYTPNTANNPTQVLLPDDGDPPVADSVNIPFKGIADKLFRMLDRLGGGTIQSLVQVASGASIEWLNGSFMTVDAGTFIAVQAGVTETHANDVSLNGTTTIGAAGSLDLAGRGIVRQPIALTSTGRIKVRVSELPGTGNTTANANTFDEFLYTALTGDRVFNLDHTNAEDGDRVRVSLASVATGANIVEVRDSGGNVITLHTVATGPFVWADFTYRGSGTPQWRMTAYGP